MSCGTEDVVGVVEVLAPRSDRRPATALPTGQGGLMVPGRREEAPEEV